MKRKPLQRLSSFLPKPSNRLTVQQLESRDVPAAFFVDPAYNGTTPDSTHFSGVPLANFGLANAGNTFKGDFAGFGAAIAAAQASPGPDTIYFGNGTSVIPNAPSSSITINDNLTFVGGGASKSQMVVGNNLDYANLPYDSTVFETYTGSSLNLQDFTYNGTGVGAAAAFYYQGTTSTIKGVDFIGYGTGSKTPYTNEGQAVWAAGGSTVTITGGTFTNTQGRSGVYVTSGSATPSTVNITGTTFLGNAGHYSFGVELAGNAKANISGSTFTGHTNINSAGVVAYAAAGYSPEITVVRNTFSNNTVAIYVGDNGVVGDKTSALIAYNNITGNAQYSIQGNTLNNGQVVNARFNYFGGGAPTGLNSTFGIVNSSQFLTAPVGTVIAAKNTFVTGANVSIGNPVNVYNVGSPTPSKSYNPAFPNFSTTATGEARVAYADLTGDGVLDVIIGSGSSDTVQVYNGSTGALINQFFALTATNKATAFAGGVYVAAGDINGDGQIDVVVSQGNWDPRIVVLNGTSVVAGAAQPTKLRDFMDSFGRSGYLGVTVAVGDFNGDGYDDIATGVTILNNGTVRVYDGKFLTTGVQAGITTSRTAPLNPTPNVSFSVSPGFPTGVNVAAGDVNGDGRADLVAGMQSLGANIRVYTFTAGSLLAPQTTGTPFKAADFFAGPQNSVARVAARDTNNDGFADILFTIGTGTPSIYRIDGSSLTLASPYTGPTDVVPPPSVATLLVAAYTSTSKGAWVA